MPSLAGRVDRESGLISAFGEDDAGELYVLTTEGYVFGISAADDPA